MYMNLELDKLWKVLSNVVAVSINSATILSSKDQLILNIVLMLINTKIAIKI